MELVLSGGKLNIINNGEIDAFDLRFSVLYEGDAEEHEIPGEWRADGEAFACGDMRLEWRCEDAAILWRVLLRVSADCRIKEIICRAGLPRALDKCIHFEVKNDLPANMLQHMQLKSFADTDSVLGADMSVLKDSDGKEYIFGFATFKRYTSLLRADKNGEIVFRQMLEGLRFSAGELVECDFCCLMPCRDARYALTEYARTVGRLNDEGYEKKPVPAGWCSWYYYLERVTPDEVLSNVRFLSEHREDIPISYIQTDDGWLTRKWELEPNEKFSAVGMKDFADKIRAEGFKPGIWLAPFTVLKDSKLHKEHPEWLVRDYETGEPKLFDRFGFAMYCYLLDITHPEAERFLRDTMHRITHEWGYRYIKLDFMLCNMLIGKRYDPAVSSVMAYRKALSIIREEITEDTYFLDCTAPFFSSVGLCDGMRVSGDVFGDWASLLGIFFQTNKRYFMNYGMFNNDADCLIIRKADEEDAMCGRANLRNDTEIETYVTMMSASGGALLLSDKLELVKDKTLERIRSLFPINTRTAIPLDLWENNILCVLDFGKRGLIRPISLTNWDNSAKEMALPIEGEEHIYEYWSRTYLGVHSTFTASLEAHQTKLYFTVPANINFAIIGSEDCICPEIEQSASGRVLNARLPKAGAYFVISPAEPSSANGCNIEKCGNGWRVVATEKNIEICI